LPAKLLFVSVVAQRSNTEFPSIGKYPAHPFAMGGRSSFRSQFDQISVTEGDNFNGSPGNLGKLMTPETLTLPSSLFIRGITSVHESLLAALKDNKAITLDIPDDAQADLSFIQLIEASRLYARTEGKYITLTKPASPGVLKTLRRGGFLTTMDEASRLFWLHGKEIQ
jgi:hypothetical protein